MLVLDYQTLRAAPLQRDPFDYVIVPGAVRRDALGEIHRDFPKVDRAGSLPLAGLEYGPAFARLIDELRGPEMSAAMADIFGIDLERRHTMVTVRARCRERDGRIHTDSKGKLLTVLVYLNETWEAGGGRLRLLRSPDDIDDYVAEVPPDDGTLLAFRCSDNAWHGHKTYSGVRRAIQLNWVVDEGYLRREQRRHRFSALCKRLGLAS
jgi:hypothetical protein